MDKRNLTGKWYLKKTFWGNYKLKVQVKVQIWDDPSYGNGGGSYAPERTEYQDATTDDLMELEINNI